jgi:hypothetical protein
MLSTFLTQLQSYFSKYFVVGSFFPMLACVFLNGLIAYPLIGGWQRWADDNIVNAGAGKTAFVTTSIVVAILLASYVLGALSTFLRRVLEGQWSGVLRDWFVSAQNRRREKISRDRRAEGEAMADLSYDAPNWNRKIADAWSDGRKDHPGVAWTPPDPNTIEQTLAQFERRRDRYEPVSSQDIENLAGQVADALKTCDGNQTGHFTGYNRRLNELVDYAGARAGARHARLQNELNSNYGLQDLAPTKMGNVANTIQGYTLRRYRCNFEIVWSNLTRIVMKDEKASATLMEAKTQLDFLVACCWLTLVSAAGWSCVFAVLDPNRGAFLAAALGGPLIAYMWYRAAAEQYRSFADVLMTSFDTFRFQMLTEMRLALPVDVEDERETWEQFDKLTTFGEVQNFQYQPPKQP